MEQEKFVDNMKKIKKTSDKFKMFFDGLPHKGYMLGDLPPTFGKKWIEDYDEEGELNLKQGISKWYNYKGLTWIRIMN